MKENQVLHFFDPYKQSVFYFKTDLFDWIVFFAICVFIYNHKTNIWIVCLLYNPLFSYPNLFIHSLFGHLFLGQLARSIFAAVFGFMLPLDTVHTVGELLLVGAGSFSEMILPVLGIIICLRIAGGRYILPVMLYGLSVAVFDLGMYIVNPASQQDMLWYNNVENADWTFILDTLNLQAYAEPIGNAIIFLSIALFVLAAWSPFYYWRHMNQYPIPYSEFW